MPSNSLERLRLFALCLAVLFRVVAYTSVAILAIKSLQNGVFATYNPGVLAAWLGMCAVPALLFWSVIGPLAASRWNRVITTVGTAIVVAVLGWAAANEDVPWLSVVGVLSLEAAFFVCAAMARTSTLALRAAVSRVSVQWFVVLAAMSGVWLVGSGPGSEFLLNPRGALASSIASFVAIVFVNGFSAEPIKLAEVGIVKPFLTGMRDLFRNRLARIAWIGVCVWWFVALVFLTVVIRTAVAREEPWRNTAILVPRPAYRVDGLQFLTAILGGVLLSGLNRHPYRHTAFVVLGALLAAASCVWLQFADQSTGARLMLGIALGVSLSPLIQLLLNNTTTKYHGIAASCMIAALAFASLVLAVVVFNLGTDLSSVRVQCLNMLVGVTVVAAIAAFFVLFRPALETTVEFLLWPIYRITSTGPGVPRLPLHGPCLVIGNHAAWFDPLYFAKVLPSPIIPMMTSKFYDLPVLSWLMRHVIHTIRVPDVGYRHEAPELREAVAALDRGAYIALFPEGYLRRKEEVPLRRFGRGVWKILSERPSTPVFACWFEGPWGSFFSHRGGPPTKGKRFDFFLKIRIGIVGPITIDPATLANHMATRTFLMQKVAEARAPLGLPPLALKAVEDDNE